MAKILILGAGRGQVDLIKAVKKYGHTAVVATIPGSYPGIDWADEVIYSDISNPEQIDQAVINYGIQAVCTCCFDTAMASLGYVCEKNGLIGVSREAGSTARDKLLMKERMIAGGVRTPAYRKIVCQEDLVAIPNYLNFPVVIKPVDQQGSLGVSIVETADMLNNAYINATENTNNHYCLAEEYIEGQKHGANGCVANGEILFILPSEDITDGTSVLGHVLPFDADPDLHNEIIQQTTMALRAIGIDNCIFNVDYIVKDGKAYILEITGRMGANGIPQLLSLYYGIDIYKLLIDLSLGKNLDSYRFGSDYIGTPCCSKMLISQKSGVLKSIQDQTADDTSIVERTFFVSAGQMVSAYRSAKDCVGQLIVKGETPEQCKAKAREIEENILLILE
jgi:biotin carboxylase